MTRTGLLSFLLVAFVFVASASASAQVRFRRPYSGSFGLGYGFDNDGGGGGCRDYDCSSTCYDGHGGEDFAAPWGSEVVAGQDGRVLVASDGCANTGYAGNPCGGYCGNYVQIQHADGSTTTYCHMLSGSLRVSPGATVRCGDPIGSSASSGSSSGPHLHFGFRNPGGRSEEVFRGACGRGTSLWVEQRGHAEAPGAECADCGARAEVCNGVDDNCNGLIDESEDCGTRCGGSPRTVGAIDAKYRELGACDSFLGIPTTDELITPDGVGRYNHFVRGSIYWTPETGAHEVHDLIHAKWESLGWETGLLGYPLTDELTTPDGVGRYNHFQNGSIYWSPAHGAFEVHGAIREVWGASGWETGALGYPVSDEYAVEGGRRSDFEFGYIRYDAASDTTTIHLTADEVPDAGPSLDAGPESEDGGRDAGRPTPDAETGSPDGGSPSAPAGLRSGCACTVTADAAEHFSSRGWALMGAFLVLAAARRQRRR